MIENSSCVVTGCNFTRNETQANSFGGTIKIASSSPTISNCVFTENKNSVNSGGAIYIVKILLLTYLKIILLIILLQVGEVQFMHRIKFFCNWWAFCWKLVILGWSSCYLRNYRY